ncbi:MAG: transglutaminase domain-containing protein [Deltaproteobacteria bacterium]|nr:transglutaminase domain-containing protein [Deltaproteobacteria bacterium]
MEETQDLEKYLRPTPIIDSDAPAILQHAHRIVGEFTTPVERAVRLYLAVRDGIRYDPYAPFHLPRHYQASWVLRRGRSFCIPKASLLCALARASSIPARVGFATVRNHLATKQLLDYLGSDTFVCHAYTDLYLEGKWVKATPAFNKELCERHGVSPLEFNGREDSLFHAYDGENRRFMEYLVYTGTHWDIPVAEILIAWKRAYGACRIENLIRAFEQLEDKSMGDFDSEEVLKA